MRLENNNPKETKKRLQNLKTVFQAMMNTGGATTTTSTATAATAGGINNSDTVYKLSHLPLRPGTLALLTKRGFHSTADVRLSKDGGGGVGGTSSNNTTVGGGISNFASELDSTIMEAVRISREVDTAIRSLTNSNSSYDDDCLKNRDRIRNCNDLSRQQKTTIIDTNHQAVSSFRFKHQEQQQKQHHRTLPQTAAQILSSQLQNPLSTRPIISFVKSIDSLLGGGFQTKEIIEVAGLPGVGKTQLAMQLCVDTFLPKQFGGLGGHSVYIDSEGSFSPERCHDMAKALVNHVQSNSQRRRQRRKQHQKEQDVVENATTGGSLVSNNFTPESILESINVFRVYDETCQSATILSLPKFLNTMKKSGKIVNLIVIDSIAFHYRCSSSDYKSRTKSLTSTAAFLSDLANVFDLSIVIINQMTTKIGGGVSNHDSNSSSSMNNNNISGSVTPALGESWAHSTTTRLLLMFDHDSSSSTATQENGEYHLQNQRRICKLVKSPHKAAGTASFRVTEFGLRDVIH